MSLTLVAGSDHLWRGPSDPEGPFAAALKFAADADLSLAGFRLVKVGLPGYGVPGGATVDLLLRTLVAPSNDVHRRFVMAVQLFHMGERARRSADVPDVLGPLDTLGRDGGVSVGLRCECTSVSLGAPPDDVIVVRVAGEVDLLTRPVLQDALADSLARGPCDLLVDLAAMTFCDVRGMTMLVQAGATAAERGVGYAVAAAPRQVRQVWPKLWPAAELPVQFPSATAGVLAALTRRHDDDLARWALKRGPGWSRHWPKPTTAGCARRGSVIAGRIVGPLG